MNHLSEKNSILNRPMYLCLCPVCLGQFLDTGIYTLTCTTVIGTGYIST